MWAIELQGWIPFMAFAININASGGTGARIRDYWAKFGRLEPLPSMAALDYPPHVTLAIYDTIPAGKLQETSRVAFRGCPPVRLRFDKLAYFEHPQLVFWAAPEPSGSLLRVHAAVHGLIDPSLCREHYRPGQWVPHCTLATNVSPNYRQEALALASKGIEPFDVVFDRADCVEFTPVRIIEGYTLLEASP
jgi:2'-5' RNA ligase